MKKANFVSVFKKGDKQMLKNYGSVSQLPISVNIFEKLISMKCSSFFIEDDVIPSNQSVFKPDDSCINQF